MVAVRTFQDGFAGGELQHSMHRAVNNPVYNRSAKRIENFDMQLQGPLDFRNGYRHHIITKGGTEAVLIEWKFSENDFYILEFGATYMRVHEVDSNNKPKVVVSSSGIITAITQASEGVVTSAAHGLSNGDQLYFVDTNGMLSLNNRIFEVSDVPTNTFKLKDTITGDYIDTSGLDAYVSNGTSNRWNLIFELTTPYSAFNDLRQMKFAQFGNVMYVAHPSYKPRVITRTSSTAWTIGNYAPTADPFTSTNNYPRAVCIYENRIIWGGTNTHPYRIFGTVSADFNDMTIGTAATDAFIFNLTGNEAMNVLWLDHNERYLIAGTLSGVNKVYGANEEAAITPTSITNRRLCETNTDDVVPVMVDGRMVFVELGRNRIRALEFDIARDGYDALDMNIVSNHIVKSNILDIAFNDSFPDTLYAVRTDGVLAKCAVNFRENIYGWARDTSNFGLFESVKTAGGLVWAIVKRVDEAGNTVRSIEVKAERVNFPVRDDYFSGEENETADELSFLDATYEAQKISNHLDQSMIYDGLFPREINLSSAGTLNNRPITLTALTGDGVTVTASGGNAFRSDDVGKYIMGGNGRGIGEIVTFTSATEVEIDVISDFNSLTFGLREWYLTTSEMYNLHHLEGATVDVIADGGYIGTKTVSEGRISLGEQYSYVIVGKKYNGVIHGLPINFIGRSGAVISKLKNVNKLGLCLRNALGLRYGMDIYSMENYNYKSEDDIIDRVTPLYNGVREFKVDSSWDRDKSFLFLQESPYPCQIQAVIPYLDSSGA